MHTLLSGVGTHTSLCHGSHCCPQASSGEGGPVVPESPMGVEAGWGMDQSGVEQPPKAQGMKLRHDSSTSEGRKVRIV